MGVCQVTFINNVGGVVYYGYWKEKVKYKTQFCC